ncbi:MAG: glycosylase [Oscillospiraceae bacterium]|nr:glycosylase [Oscillospiraceae bacterium]
MAAGWLKDAVFYEIYPQSFYDSNGDGIGDINGITEKLDYVKSLGCNALWLNPLYDSPFKDAGYDVRDYKKVASRYGTNEDLENLFRTAHEKGIHVLLDLVPGHTSEEHPWFVKSCEPEMNAYSHRYIWTDSAFTRGDTMPFVGGETPRDGTYIINFFKCQPALNYGWREIREPSWQMSPEDPEPMKTREAIKDVMRFWLSRGCDGFRVDMADSLVKNDGEEKPATMAVWKDIAGTIHEEFPEAALVSEWNKPRQALNCGFDMDFFLNWRGNGYSSLLRDYDIPRFGGEFGENSSYFKADAARDISRFLEDYLPQYEDTKDKGLWCFITGNHDTLRVAPLLDETERRLAFAFLLTMPGAPFIYYGDEIGMNYRWVPTKEGGYQRTGSRTPMQWSKGKNLGFSEAEADRLYLPVDPAGDAATVAEQEKDPDSFLNHVRGLIALRREYRDLGNYSNFAVYSAEPGSRLFAYKRGELLLAVNPSREALELKLDSAYEAVYTIGEPAVQGGSLTMGGQSFAVLKRAE